MSLPAVLFELNRQEVTAERRELRNDFFYCAPNILADKISGHAVDE